jgi:hypothetical protein
MAGLRVGLRDRHTRRRSAIRRTRCRSARLPNIWAAPSTGLGNQRAHRHRARAQHRGARLHDEGVPGDGLQRHRLADQLPLREHQGARRPFRDACREPACWSAATSRRTRRRTAASPWAPWPKCSARCTCSARCWAHHDRGGAAWPVTACRSRSEGGFHVALATSVRPDAERRRRRRCGSAAGAARPRSSAGLQGLHAQGPAPSIILASNENPLGPGQPTCSNAVRGSFSEAGRYPFATAADVTRAHREKHKLKPQNVLSGRAPRRSCGRRPTSSRRRRAARGLRSRPTRSAPTTRA